MVNQKAMFAIVAIVATLSVAAIVRAIMSTTMAKSDQFSSTGNLYDSPGAGDGNPHRNPKTENPLLQQARYLQNHDFQLGIAFRMLI